MKSALRSIALLLLALWLPATQHCELVAAGLAPVAVTCQDDHAPAGVPADNCGLIEHDAYRSPTLTLAVPAPALLTCLFCLVEITPETTLVPLISPDRSDSPPELANTWQFAHRAAPPSRAPASLV